MLADTAIYEVFVQWAAYGELCERLGDQDARTSDPRDLIGKVAAYGHGRAAAAIFAAGVTADYADAQHVLKELLDLAAHGRRPRYGNEVDPDFYAQLTGAHPPHEPGGTT
ncbi:MAG: hypothetical protein Q8O56_14025 [Solirubrobacteraceae bacterium]|nr:hypothetical protein [Solirubrobacteraceae bacterium]